jgi:hypothetical protein
LEIFLTEHPAQGDFLVELGAGVFEEFFDELCRRLGTYLSERALPFLRGTFRNSSDRTYKSVKFIHCGRVRSMTFI